MQLPLLGLTHRERHLSEIRNLYWRLRSLRPHQGALRRKLYRLVTKQKAVLIADGLDKEALRLWCRQWANCYRAASEERFRAYCEKNSILFEKTRKAYK